MTPLGQFKPHICIGILHCWGSESPRLALRSLIAAATGEVLLKSGIGGGAVSALLPMMKPTECAALECQVLLLRSAYCPDRTSAELRDATKGPRVQTSTHAVRATFSGQTRTWSRSQAVVCRRGLD